LITSRYEGSGPNRVKYDIFSDGSQEGPFEDPEPGFLQPPPDYIPNIGPNPGFSRGVTLEDQLRALAALGLGIE
jgi:hypothetical protein